MLLIILESPYSENIDENAIYARACVRDSLLRGEAPIASHLLYTQPGVLNDTIITERMHGIDAGLAWLKVATLHVVYTDLGITPEMQCGIYAAAANGVKTEYRTLKIVNDPRRISCYRGYFEMTSQNNSYSDILHSSYQIRSAEHIGFSIIVHVTYPAVSGFEKDKILVFEGLTPSEIYSWNQLNPHFLSENAALVASFVPSPMGLRLAQCFCNARNGVVPR